MPSLAQKAFMVSPVALCLLISSRIFDSFIILYVLAEINQTQQLRKDVLGRMLTMGKMSEYFKEFY